MIQTKKGLLYLESKEFTDVVNNYRDLYADLAGSIVSRMSDADIETIFQFDEDTINKRKHHPFVESSFFLKYYRLPESDAEIARFFALQLTHGDILNDLNVIFELTMYKTDEYYVYECFIDVSKL